MAPAMSGPTGLSIVVVVMPWVNVAVADMGGSSSMKPNWSD